MPLTDQELDALSDYLLTVVECDPDFEDDCFGIEFAGHAFYVERKRTHFRIALGHGDLFVELPRISF